MSHSMHLDLPAKITPTKNLLVNRAFESEAQIIEGILEAQQQVKKGDVHSHESVIFAMNEKLEKFKNK